MDQTDPITPHWRPNAYPRVIAIGLLRQEERLLCAEVTHDDGSVKGYRPLGGGIEMGETAQMALERELMEEVEARVIVGPHRAVLENIFTHEGVQGHEIVFVHEVTVIDPGKIEGGRFLRAEAGRVTALDWVDITALKSGAVTLFPDGLAALF